MRVGVMRDRDQLTVTRGVGVRVLGGQRVAKQAVGQNAADDGEHDALTAQTLQHEIQSRLPISWTPVKADRIVGPS